MKVSRNAIELIKHYEGKENIAYRCAAGKWTIGYGHTGEDVKPGLIIDDSQAETLLKNDLNKFEKGVEKLCSEVSQKEFDALVCFAFNVGLGNLKESTLLKKLKNNSPKVDVALEFEKWVYGGGKKLKGLEKRRKSERYLFLHNELCLF